MTAPAPASGGPGTADPDDVLVVEDLEVQFATDRGWATVVEEVSFSVPRGSTVGIVGESGSGKSVTSLAIMGLIPSPPGRIVKGRIRLDGTELVGRKESELSDIRGDRMAMVFQEPMTSLNPAYSVGDQIAEVVRRHRTVSRRAAVDRAVEAMDLVGIPNARSRVRSYPHEFSGGMRQRVMIAMALSCEPSLLIADEPTTALDVTIQAQILEVLERAQAAVGSAIILITHDLGVVAGMADRVLVMYAGRAVEQGNVDDVFANPRHPYTLGLLESLPRLDGEGHERLTPITGAPPSLLHPPPGCPFHPRCQFVRPLCSEVLPELRMVGGLGQRSACHYAEELEGRGAEVEAR
ncbi:MAG: ABC transporter ATP-binding protein [Acidimicrobiales bacterium]